MPLFKRTRISTTDPLCVFFSLPRLGRGYPSVSVLLIRKILYLHVSFHYKANLDIFLKLCFCIPVNHGTYLSHTHAGTQKAVDMSSHSKQNSKSRGYVITQQARKLNLRDSMYTTIKILLPIYATTLPYTILPSTIPRSVARYFDINLIKEMRLL